MLKARLILVTSCLIVVSCGIIALWLMLAGRGSSDWPSVAGVIVSSSIGDHNNYHMGKKTTTHYPLVLYRYKVASELFKGKRVTLHDDSGNMGEARKISKRYAPGMEVIVYYDPGNPHKSVLEPGFNRGYLFNFLFVVSVFFGGIAIWILRISNREQKRVW
ncbi:MAG: DUF3592 domain-containing protein [Desulfobulbaceae bacterium]|nr:DUF3592 domain-containing protein [Desulfobulbaceae bacterium]